MTANLPSSSRCAPRDAAHDVASADGTIFAGRPDPVACSPRCRDGERPKRPAMRRHRMKRRIRSLRSPRSCKRRANRIECPDDKRLTRTPARERGYSLPDEERATPWELYRSFVVRAGSAACAAAMITSPPCTSSSARVAARTCVRTTSARRAASIVASRSSRSSSAPAAPRRR